MLANVAGATVFANLAKIGGNGINPVFTMAVGSDPNLTISGSQLVAVASPNVTPGTTPHYGVSCTDSGGTFTAVSSAHSYSVPAGPTGITGSPVIQTNAVLGTSAGLLMPVGGWPPYVWTTPLSYGGFFDIASPGNSSQLTLNSAGVRHLTAGLLAGTVHITDAAGLQSANISIPITVQNPGASSLVSQIIINNDDTIASPVNAITQMFGHKFKEGDIVAGTFPDFRLQDGTVLEYSMSTVPFSLFSPTDGSLWDTTFMLGVPNAIPAAFTATVTTTAGLNTATMASTALLVDAMGITGVNISCQKPTGVASITNATDFVLTKPAVRSGSFTATFNGVLVDIKTHGAGPGISARGITDFAAGNLNIKSTIVYRVSGVGTVVCGINDGFARNQPGTIKFMDGACGAVWFQPAVPYVGSGGDDPLLHGDIVAVSLQNPAGGQHGFRELITVGNGFPDVAGNDYKVFNSVVTDDGLGHSFDCYSPSGVGATRTMAAATIGNNEFPLAVAQRDFNGGEYLVVAGSPPAPMNAGDIVIVQKYGIPAGKVQLNTFANGSTQGATRITPTSVGGSWTLQPFPWLVPFGKGSDASGNPRPRFYQGSGTATADAILRITKDTDYLLSTGWYPPYDLDGADYQHNGTRPTQPDNPPSADQTSQLYFWGTSNPFNQRSFSAASPEPTGYDLYSANHFFVQTKLSERLSTMMAFEGMQFGIHWRSGKAATRGRMIPLNNTQYNTAPVMPPPAPNFSYGANQQTGSGYPSPGTGPVTVKMEMPGFDGQGFDHWYCFFTGAADNLREPQFLEWMYDDANHAIMGWSPSTGKGNNYTASTWQSGGNVRLVSNPPPGGAGVLRYAMNIGGQLQNGRIESWMCRNVSHAASRIVRGSPEYQYFHDWWDNTLLNFKEMYANQQTLNSFAAASGIFLKGGTNFVMDLWQSAGYMGQGQGPAANYVKYNPDALILIKASLNNITRWINLLGLPLATSQESPVAAVSGSPAGALLPSTALMSSQGPNIHWTAGNTTFTWSGWTINSLGGYDFTMSTLAHPDFLIFTSHTPPSENIVLPGGATEMVPYYIEPTGQTTGLLHRNADWSDPPLNPNTSYSGGSGYWLHVTNYAAKFNFPTHSQALGGSFFNQAWDAVATALAVLSPSEVTANSDANGLAAIQTAWQAGLTLGKLSQASPGGGGSNYLGTTL